MGVKGQLHVQVALQRPNGPSVTNKKEMGAPQSRSAHCGEGKYISCPHLDSNCDSSVVSAVAYRYPDYAMHGETNAIKYENEPGTTSLLKLKFVFLCVYISSTSLGALYLHILYVWYLNSL